MFWLMRVTGLNPKVRGDQSLSTYIAIAEYTELILAISPFTASCFFVYFLFSLFDLLVRQLIWAEKLHLLSHLHFNEVL